MTFLAPALLLLGLAVAVPLILHLLQRHQGPRMVFPALRYLKRAEREHATRIRLRQVLLLALRVLALLLLAAAAARPFLRGGGSGHEPTSVVLVLDNSLSSGAVAGDRLVLDGLKDAALETLAAAGPDDRFWLIRAGTSWEPAVSGDAAAVAAAVRETVPMAGAADLAAEVERASSILAGQSSEGRASEIQVLSDLQATALGRPAREDSGAVIVLSPDAPPPPNRGVSAVEVGGGMAPRAGERSTVSARLTGSSEAEQVSARLVLDGMVRAAAEVESGSDVVFAFPARETGITIGRVEVDADALTADDRRHFVVRVTPPPSVALTEPLPFLSEAVDVLEDAGRISRAAPGSADVVLAPGAVGAESVREGRAVVVFPPASMLEISAANRRLAAAGIPWRYGPPATGEARLAPPEADLGAALSEVRLRQVYRLEPQGSPGDSTLVRLTGGEPWAVAGQIAGAGRYVLLATPLTAEGGSIPTSAAMLPLLDRAIGAWAAGEAAGSGHVPGDVVTLPGADSIVGPGGSTGAAQEGTVQRLTETGVYRAFRNGEVVAAYAVNPAPEESRLARADPTALRDLLPGRELRVASRGDWEDAIYVRRLGREIVWPLVLAALLVLVVESALAAPGRGLSRTARGGGGTAAAAGTTRPRSPEPV